MVLVAITSAGRQHLRAMRRAGASVFRALIDNLTGPERAALSAALPALRQLVELAADSPDSQPRSANATSDVPARARAVRRGPALTVASVEPRGDRMTQVRAALPVPDSSDQAVGATAPGDRGPDWMVRRPAGTRSPGRPARP